MPSNPQPNRRDRPRNQGKSSRSRRWQKSHLQYDPTQAPERKFTTEEVGKILCMQALGHSWKNIGKRLGISPDEIMLLMAPIRTWAWEYEPEEAFAYLLMNGGPIADEGLMKILQPYMEI